MFKWRNDELAELKAELADWQDRANMLRNALHRTMDHNSELKHENQELRKRNKRLTFGLKRVAVHADALQTLAGRAYEDGGSETE